MPAPSQQIADFYAAEAAGQPLDTKMQAAVNTLRQAGELPPAGHDWNVEFTDSSGVGWNAQGTPSVAGGTILPEATSAPIPAPAKGQTFTYDDPHDAFAAFVREHGPNPDIPALMVEAHKAGVPVDQLDMGRISALLSTSPPVGAAPEAAASPEAPTTIDTTDPFMATMASILGRMGQGASALIQAAKPQKGEDPGVLATLERSPRMLTLENLGNLAQAAGPVGLGGPAAAGELAGGVLARTLGPYSPVSPETAETIGAFSPLAPGVIRGGARLLSPTLRQIGRTGEEMAAKGLANVGTGIGQAGQLAEQRATGAATKEAAEAIGRRLGREATGFQEIPVGGAPETVTSTSLSKSGKLISKEVPVAAEAAPLVRDADYATDFAAMRKANERGAMVAKDFEQSVLKKTRGLGSHETARHLAKDPDLLNGLLAHADPEEAALFRRAVESGSNLADLPFNHAEMARLEALIANPSRPSILGNVSLRGMLKLGGAAGLGAVLGPLAAKAGSPVGAKTAAAVAGGLYVGRTALRGLDALISSRGGQALLRQLNGIPPTSPEAIQIMGALADRLVGPVEMEKRD